MYESARAHMKPRDIRSRACSLMRQCWKTLLIAAVLMCLFGWASIAVEARGKHLAQQASDTARAAFMAEHPVPEDKENSDEWAFHYEWMANHNAEKAYNETYRPWKWAVGGLDLIGLLFSCVIAVRLSRGLLNALRGEECTPQCLRSGWARTSTVCWLAVQRELRIGLWALLPLIFHFALDIFFGVYAGTVSTLLILLVAIWAGMHYALAEMHLADDPYSTMTASDALRLAVDDADAFTIRAMCGVLWPVVIPYGVIIVVGCLAIFGMAPVLLASIVDALCSLLITLFLTPCYVCIYDEIRQRIRAAEEAVPPTEGLARARALAANDD